MSRFAKLAVATVAATLLLIGLGGLVRATDSGLGCPDWPGCFGRLVPPAGRPHAWIEHVHRYWAAVVIGMLGWLAFEARRSGQPIRVRKVTLYGLIPIVLAQALLGAVVVWIKLHWVSVSSHLALALGTLGLATWVAVDALRREDRLRVGSSGSARLHTLTGVTAVLVFAQMILGSMVTGFDAGMAYSTFPSWNNRPLPEFTPGLVWPQSLHVAHRVVAFVLLGAVVALVVRSRRPGVPPLIRRCAWIALALVVVQIVLGVLNLRYVLSAWTVVPHMVVGASIWITMLVAAFCARAQPTTAVDVDEARASVSAP